jgi:hypothetical protein
MIAPIPDIMRMLATREEDRDQRNHGLGHRGANRRKDASDRTLGDAE